LFLSRFSRFSDLPINLFSHDPPADEDDEDSENPEEELPWGSGRFWPASVFVCDCLPPVAPAFSPGVSPRLPAFSTSWTGTGS
jgi:hypothetical protein